MSPYKYHYSTPIEDPAVILKVVNCALDVPISITQQELLSISPEARKQYKELTTMWQVSSRTTEVDKLEEVPDDSLAVLRLQPYSLFTISKQYLPFTNYV
jgi:hypothetical protein